MGGDVLQSVWVSVSIIYLSHQGRYGVAVGGGVEKMVVTGKLAYEEGCTVPSLNNRLCLHRILPDLAEIGLPPQGGTPSMCTAGSHRCSCMPWRDGTGRRR